MYDPAIRYVQLGVNEGKRFKKLGDFGEIIAGSILESNGFLNIQNLNEIKNNFPFADFYAQKDGIDYLISVKTRNKFENTGKVNSRYKLGDILKKTKLIKDDCKYIQYHNCIYAWMTISMEEETFDAYFGLIDELPGSKRGIPMSNAAKQKYSCLALQKSHIFKSEDFINIYNSKKE